MTEDDWPPTDMHIPETKEVIEVGSYDRTVTTEDMGDRIDIMGQGGREIAHLSLT